MEDLTLRQYLQDNKKLMYRARKKSQVYIEDMTVHEVILLSMRSWDIIATKDPREHNGFSISAIMLASSSDVVGQRHLQTRDRRNP